MTTPMPDFFDDLSRRWQQAPTAAPAVADWPMLLARTAHSPVTRMVRNVWVELVACVLVVVPLLLALVRWSGPTAAALAGLTGLSLYYYGRQLLLLHRLRALASDPLRRHAAERLRQLRQLLRFYHHLALLLTAVVGVGMVYVGSLYVLPLLPTGEAGNFWLWLGLSVLTGVVITHYCVRWQLQHAYGQHLDQLEAVLQELADEPAAEAGGV